jgi:hypothetical protein
MTQVILKVLITSILVVAISEAAKRSSLFGALVASLPLTSLLAMGWLYADTGDAQKVADLAYGIFWLVLPSLILFLLLPYLLNKGYAFVPSLAVSIFATAGGYLAMLALLKRAGIQI